MRIELWWTRRRAGELPHDRRQEQRLRDEALRAGREQVLANIGMHPDRLVLMDEHLIVGVMPLPLVAVEAVDLELRVQVAVRVTTATGSITVPLTGTSYAAATIRGRRVGHHALSPDVHGVYDARREAGMAKPRGFGAERDADRERCTARARQLECALQVATFASD
jgi:hypothetical protein